MERLGFELRNPYCHNNLQGCNVTIEHNHLIFGLVTDQTPKCPLCNKILRSDLNKESIISPLSCVSQGCAWNFQENGEKVQ